MKLNLNRIGAFFVRVGSAAAILASGSASNAATFNWSFDGLANTSGTFTFTENNGVIDSFDGTILGSRITGLLPGGMYNGENGLGANVTTLESPITTSDPLYDFSYSFYTLTDNYLTYFYFYDRELFQISFNNEIKLSYNEINLFPVFAAPLSVPEPGATISFYNEIKPVPVFLTLSVPEPTISFYNEIELVSGFVAAPLPLSVPEPGATIPTAVVSLIALGALKKSRKSIALKTTIANPVISVVS